MLALSPPRRRSCRRSLPWFSPPVSVRSRCLHRRRRAASRRCVMARRSLIIGYAIVGGLWLVPPAGAHQQCLPNQPTLLNGECHPHNPATGVGARSTPATLTMNTWTQGTLIEHHEDRNWGISTCSTSPAPESSRLKCMGPSPAPCRSSPSLNTPERFQIAHRWDGTPKELGPPGSKSRRVLAM